MWISLKCRVEGWLQVSYSVFPICMWSMCLILGLALRVNLIWLMMSFNAIDKYIENSLISICQFNFKCKLNMGKEYTIYNSRTIIISQTFPKLNYLYLKEYQVVCSKCLTATSLKTEWSWFVCFPVSLVYIPPVWTTSSYPWAIMNAELGRNVHNWLLQASSVRPCHIEK